MILMEACGTKQNVHDIEVFVLKKYMVECRTLLRMRFGWPEGHCLSSSKGDDGTNGVTDFTSSDGSLLG